MTSQLSPTEVREGRWHTRSRRQLKPPYVQVSLDTFHKANLPQAGKKTWAICAELALDPRPGCLALGAEP